MNPIDQLMQSIGSSPSPAIAGLLGVSQASGAGQSDLAAQFAQALQSIETASVVPGTAVSEALDLTTEQAELLASLQATLPPEMMPAQLQGAPFAGLTADLTESSASSAQSAQQAKAGVSGIAIQAALAGSQAAAMSAQGITSQQSGQDISILPQAALEKLGLKLEQLPALPSTEQLAAVSQAGVSTNSHILPATAAQGLFGVAVEKAPVLTPGAEGTTVQATPNALGQAGQAQLPEETLAAPLDKPALTAAPVNGAQAATPSLQGLAQGQQQAVPTVTPQSEQPSQAAPATPQAPAEAQADEVEGNGVVTQQAQQQVAAAAPKSVADRTVPTTNKANSGPGKEQLDFKVTAEPAADTLKEAASAKPVEPVSKLPETQAPAPAREALPPLTPERVAGFFDSTSANAVAAGLSGLKGETGFMASMSLLGGKPSPELAQQVSQQLNMHVTKAVNDGQQAFTVRLDPAELGRVRVKLSFLEGGKVHAQVMAERPETLDLMQRDTRGLERALESAGHKADGGIQFSLDTNDQESAGRAFAEAVQQEKMRDDLAARSGLGHGMAEGGLEVDIAEEEVPLETILANVSVETGLDIEV
ncbi:flagellar hook-length control protein FliK [Kordiimonas lipolytica]|uniref:Flagellar hook-length control protein FliK n=1 Tax=Kordiimonas lipolytica TaxID=1662421 RepID=A0ABV8UCH9_9PROT|nr:flagellar hook-length control protein FliK [Kordiimonas lipolytica]